MLWSLNGSAACGSFQQILAPISAVPLRPFVVDKDSMPLKWENVPKMSFRILALSIPSVPGSPPFPWSPTDPGLPLDPGGPIGPGGPGLPSCPAGGVLNDQYNIGMVGID